MNELTKRQLAEDFINERTGADWFKIIKLSDEEFYAWMESHRYYWDEIDQAWHEES